MQKSNAGTKIKKAAAENDEFIASFGTALQKHCPNEGRIDCPDPESLKKMAFGRPGMEELEPWFGHFMFCGACLRDFKHWRRQAAWRRRTMACLATAAAAVLFASPIVWNIVHSHRPATDTRDVLISTVLDLDDRGPSRNANEDTESALPIAQMPCAKVALSIYLPSGSEGGRYEAQIIRHHDNASPLASFTGTGRIDHARTVFSVVADFSTVPPGTYTFAYRRQGTAWQYFPVAFDVIRPTAK